MWGQSKNFKTSCKTKIIKILRTTQHVRRKMSGSKESPGVEGLLEEQEQCL